MSKQRKRKTISFSEQKLTPEEWLRLYPVLKPAGLSPGRGRKPGSKTKILVEDDAITNETRRKRRQRGQSAEFAKAEKWAVRYQLDQIEKKLKNQ